MRLSFKFGLLILMVLMCVGVSVRVSAEDYRYTLGISGGYEWLEGGNFFWFKPSSTIGGDLRYHPGGQWFLDLNYRQWRLKNDESKTLFDSIEAIHNNAPLRFKSNRVGLSLGRYLWPRYKSLNLGLSFDGALVMWRINDVVTDTTVKVHGAKSENTSLSATELSVGGTIELISRLSDRFSFTLAGSGEYLTGGGAEFEQSVTNSRDRWLLTAHASLNFHFGGNNKATNWPSDSSWNAPRTDLKSRKKNLTSPRAGAMPDADRDGVPDITDDCPGTPKEAAGMVDIHGCPIDADMDGVPDYRDLCPGTPVGATVDSNGCAIDSDGDKVPDGLDDCPDTPLGVPVDRFGCIDLSQFSKPIILHIDYLPGSFEIDLKTKDRLKKIANLLLLVPDVKIDIVGYTDNIGLPEANQKLSEKRANRVRDYLVAMGVAADRTKASGRGEDNQLGPNDTAENRAKNRRIEITFYR